MGESLFNNPSLLLFLQHINGVSDIAAAAAAAASAAAAESPLTTMSASRPKSDSSSGNATTTSNLQIRRALRSILTTQDEVCTSIYIPWYRYKLNITL